MLIKKYFQETSRSKTTCYVTACAALAILVVMTATVQQPLLYDEPIYLNAVETLKQYGLSFSFLRNLEVPAGPLYTILHNSLAPLTGLDAPGVRLVNITLLGLTILMTIGIGYLIKLTLPVLWALCMISIPMTWILSGMALTEMPAIFLMTFGFLLLIWSTTPHQTKDGKETHGKNTNVVSAKQIIAAIIGGLAMGVAISGRQPLLVTLAAVPILAIDSRSRIQVLCFLLSGAIIPIILFATWGGLVPPTHQFVGEGLSVPHLILAYCYAGGITLILSPRFFSYNFKITVIIAVFSILINAIFSWIEFVPMRTLSNQLIPEAVFPIYIEICSGLLFSLGVLYLASIIKNLINNRENLNYLFLGIATLFICFTALKVTHQFSSRYVAQAIPLFALITEPYSKANYFKATRVVIGSLLGLAILTSYYFG
jgi:4-amino-4-deoxy-L-arabinose transferase-like glycosyltransferase